MRPMKYLVMLHGIIFLVLPLLLPKSGFDARVIYWSMIGAFVLLAIIVRNQVRNTSNSAFPTPSVGLSFSIWYSIFFLITIGLIICINTEEFSAVGNIIQKWINICAKFIPVIDRYPLAALLKSSKYHSNISQIDVFKVQSTTALAVPFSTAMLIFLIFRKLLLPAKQNAFATQNSKMGYSHLIMATILAAMTLFAAYTGSFELSLTPTRRDFCISNFYCYADDGLLIFLAALFKMVCVVGFSGGVVLILSQKLRKN